MISAVIFDLDGTIIDSEPVWEEVYQMVKLHHPEIEIANMPLANGWMHEPGTGNITNWRKLVKQPEVAEALAKETTTEYSKLVQEAELKMMPGVEAAVRKVKERGWVTGLCTGTSWFVVEKQLEELGLYLAFDVTTTGDEVLMPKPDPEIYLLAAQKLEVDPEDCLVIEDAVAGVRAAAEAGMKVIGLASEYASEEILRNAGASWVEDSWEEINKQFEMLQ